MTPTQVTVTSEVTVTSPYESGSTYRATRIGQTASAKPGRGLCFVGHDDANLFFMVQVCVDHPERRGRIKSDLFYMIWDALAEHGIEVADDQLDLNLRRG